MKNLSTLFLLLTCSFVSMDLLATHNRAGEIIVRQIGDCDDLNIEATIITYTKGSSQAADRDTLTICWGDGFCEQVARNNGGGNGVNLGNDVQYNTYVASHTYAARGTYKISMTDPNRNGGILNVNPPGSDNVPFHLETSYKFLNTDFEGCNDTPILLQPPIDFACIGQKFTHDLNAYDPDGDDMSFHLVTPLQAPGIPVPNYTIPHLVSGNDSSAEVTLDEENGILCWENPLKQGEYNVAMIIVSYRNGLPIDTVLRDMQIFVEDCDDNQPPEIQTIDEICVVAGETVQFSVTGSDPDGDQIRFSALGAPFIQEVSPANDFDTVWDPFVTPPVISSGSQYENGPITKTFTWQTACEHIRKNPYTVVFKVQDNVFDTSGLAALKQVKITVVGPQPDDVQAEATSEFVDVTWLNPYECENAQEDYFKGFSVWRREGSSVFDVTCSPGLEGRGYERIEVLTNEIVDNRYAFRDEDVERGRTYCYRILGTFALTSTTGNPFNQVESLPSDEICVQLSRDVPLLVNISVEETDLNTGEIFVRWTKPDPEDLDTLQNPPPYEYDLIRIEPNGNRSNIYSVSAESYSTANDTFFTDTGLNTLENQYFYEVEFTVNNETEILGSSNDASSVFLNIASTDETNNLSWNFDVPWTNFSYEIFRQNFFTGVFESVGTSEEPNFSDTGLVNGREYCYFVEATGSYGVAGLPSPLLNLSQENCGIPLDTIPPCPPVLTVRNLCDDDVSCQDADFENRLSWANPNEICEETDDVVSYKVFYAPTEGADFREITLIEDSNDTTFIHMPDLGIAGCYAVTAIDTFNNESAFSNVFCVDNCPNYTLPNTFTPNADGQNDAFIPYPYCFIARIELQVYNQWGAVVFSTENPAINWDGKDNAGQELPSGTYYYTCHVFEERVTGIVEAPMILNGHIDLLRGAR